MQVGRCLYVPRVVLEHVCGLHRDRLRLSCALCFEIEDVA